MWLSYISLPASRVSSKTFHIFYFANRFVTRQTTATDQQTNQRFREKLQPDCAAFLALLPREIPTLMNASVCAPRRFGP